MSVMKSSLRRVIPYRTDGFVLWDTKGMRKSGRCSKRAATTDCNAWTRYMQTELRRGGVYECIGTVWPWGTRIGPTYAHKRPQSHYFVQGGTLLRMGGLSMCRWRKRRPDVSDIGWSTQPGERVFLEHQTVEKYDPFTNIPSGSMFGDEINKICS